MLALLSSPLGSGSGSVLGWGLRVSFFTTFGGRTLEQCRHGKGRDRQSGVGVGVGVLRKPAVKATYLLGVEIESASAGQSTRPSAFS